MPKKPKLQYEPEPFGPKCSGCPFKEWSRGYVPPEIRGRDVVLFGEAAGYWEALEGVPFAGKAGGKVNIWLELAHRTRLDVDLVNACRCRPITWEVCDECSGDGEIIDEFTNADVPILADCPGCRGRGWIPYTMTDGDFKNATPEPEQITECMTRYGHETLKELEKKRLIVAMGVSALYALTGFTEIGSYQGSVLDTTHGPTLVTYHPAFALYDDSMEPASMRAFKRIPGIVSGAEGAGFVVEHIKEPSKELLDETLSLKSAALDLETTGGKDPEIVGGEILLASASSRPGHSVVVPAGEALHRICNSLDEVIGQYFYAYDAWWLHHRGYRVPPVIRDTQVIGHAVDTTTPNDIGFLQTQYAEPPLKEWWKDESEYEGDLAGVALRDTDATARIERGLASAADVQGQRDLIEEVIVPWCRLAFELRRDGIRCRVGYLRDAAESLDKEVRADGAKLSEDHGIPIPKKSKVGIPSPAAVATYVYEKLGLPVQRDRKTMRRTANEKALRKLRSWCWKNGHPDGLDFLTRMIGAPGTVEGEWDVGLKQRSTMVKDLRKFAGQDPDAELRTYHAFVNLTGTVTGRLSYERPGLHQVPKHCRSAFLPDHDDHVLLQFDYKQIEFLTMLWFAEDWEKLAIGLSGSADFHRYAASLFYGVEEGVVTPVQRRNVKALNFGMIFGKGAQTTAEDLDITTVEAEKLYDRWFATFPKVPHLRDKWKGRVEMFGYLQTPAGWRMRFSRDDRENTHRRSVETQIYNYPIQSTAGIRTRAALIDLWRELGRLWDPGDVRFMLTVHDSGIISVRKDLVEKVADVVTEVVTSPYKYLPAPLPGHEDGVKFPIDLEVGPNWGEMVEYATWKENL